MIERIHLQLEMVPHQKRSLDQYFTFDPIVPYTDIALSERSGKYFFKKSFFLNLFFVEQLFIKGSKMGKYTFNFMPDYYDKINLLEEFDETQLYPKSMTEICSGVNMAALLA